ncbi:MAG TPA: zinc ribbon domain-containing protein [Pyrinomonadaceae bacterium]|nr:zinc ribbon domain-containing protein [Pyrinomonadaceae bacterium]
MFCPKCATQNLDGASFCRTCGANISLVPQALTGQLTKPETEANDCAPFGRRRNRGEVTLEHAFKNIFSGLAFLIISIVLSRVGPGQGWWFWLLIPAFVMVGTGLAQFIRLQEREKQTKVQAPPATRAFAEPAYRAEVPPSVTEGTTRHLGVETPTRHLDPSERK